MAAAVTDLEKELGKLTVAQPAKYETTLRIHGTRNMYTPVPSFTGHKLLGRFRIAEDKSYVADGVIHSKLIPSSSFARLVGANLSVGFETAIPIDNYQRYHELKQDFFLKWLIENEYFKKIKEGKYTKPDFICFGGRITDPMMSPEMERFGDWEIYATKLQGVIYLWDEKTGGARAMDMSSYYGLRFEHLLTNIDPSASSANEYDKIYVVNEVKFGTHQLLVMNEVDAQDEAGSLVELKVYKQCSPKGMKAKYVKYWAQSVVPGVAKLVIGKRDDRGRLQGVTSVSTDDLGRQQGIDTRSCLDFEDRLLKWIKECFKSAEDGNVKKFKWVCGNPAASVIEIDEHHVPKQLLPKWFADNIQDVGHMTNVADKQAGEEPAGTPPKPEEEVEEIQDGKPKEEDKEIQDGEPKKLEE